MQYTRRLATLLVLAIIAALAAAPAAVAQEEPSFEDVEAKFGGLTASDVAAMGYQVPPPQACVDLSGLPPPAVEALRQNGLPPTAAMGLHASIEALFDANVDALEPEVVLVGPSGAVWGVEYEAVAETENPVVLGREMPFLEEGHPGMDFPHYAGPHVWLEDNPWGRFADFNPNLSCAPNKAVISDDGGTNNRITVKLGNVPPLPEGTRYLAKLVDAEGESELALGELPVRGTRVNASFTTDQNLVEKYSRLVIIFGPPDLRVMEAEIPEQGMLHVRHLLVAGPSGQDPEGKGFVNGMLSEARLALEHAGLGADAGDLATARRHAEHVINIVLGTQEDLDGNGQAENPGGGVGLVPYAEAAVQHAGLAEDAAGDYEPISAHAPRVIVAAQNVIDRANRAVSEADKAVDETSLGLAGLFMQKAQVALQAAVSNPALGDDPQQFMQEVEASFAPDGPAPPKVKSGAAEAYLAAQQMARYRFVEAETGALPSVGDRALPLLPVAGAAMGLALVLAGAVLLFVRRRAVARR